MHIKKGTHSCTVDSCCHRYRPPALLLSSCVCEFGHRSAWSGKAAAELWPTWTQKHQKETKTREKLLRAAHLQLSRELNITAHYSQHSHATSSWKVCNCSCVNWGYDQTRSSKQHWQVWLRKTNDSLVQLSPCMYLAFCGAAVCHVFNLIYKR